MKTINCLIKTVDRNKHRIYVIDNGSTDKSTTRFLTAFGRLSNVHVIFNETNVGTAEAVNTGWAHRRPGEHCVKMDNDVIIHSPDWVEQLEEAINRDPSIGQCGLKRKDCWESPNNPDPNYKTELYELPHQPGQRWIHGEITNHIIGTCVMHSAALLDKVGYLYQPGLYGFDDVLMSLRSQLAGFKNVFLPHIEIDHIDPGGTEYTGWKQRAASEKFQQAMHIAGEYKAGKRSIYYNPYE